MVLADTSIWIDHFRRGHAGLAGQLSEGRVLVHPFIVGELACGNLKNRDITLSNLRALPGAKVASNDEVLRLVNDRRLWGSGLGWIDVHLLASALLTGCDFWTLDLRLKKAALEIAG